MSSALATRVTSLEDEVRILSEQIKELKVRPAPKQSTPRYVPFTERPGVKDDIKRYRAAHPQATSVLHADLIAWLAKNPA